MYIVKLLQKHSFMRCGLLVLSYLALSFGQANAAIVMTTTTKGVGGTLSVDIAGAAITSSFTGTPGTDSTIIMTYSLSGLDLSAEVAGATSVSFDFDVTYSANNSDDIEFTTGGNAGVKNAQVNGSEVLTIAVSNPTNITGFAGGTIVLDGITSVRLANFSGTEQQNLLLSDSSNILLTGSTSDTATIAATLGITGFDQTALLTSSAGLRTIGTQFTATAVPEPTSFAMLGVCGLGLFIRRRR